MKSIEPVHYEEDLSTAHCVSKICLAYIGLEWATTGVLDLVVGVVVLERTLGEY